MTLIDITDTIVIEPLISNEDRAQLIEVASDLFLSLVEEEPLLASSPYYHDILINNVCDLLSIQIGDIIPIHLHEVIEDIVVTASRITFAHFAPRRSYFCTKVRIRPNVTKIANRLSFLESVPQAAQRTSEWYQQRYNTLTASSAWQALSKSQSTVNRLIYNKCAPLDTSKYDRCNLESTLHWGQKYEDVSIMWYEREYKTKVSEFGCIPHEKYPFLAASPDGINTDPLSDRYGRMVEVKNIVNRDITGIPKEEYWIQMQLQLEVCKLRECDFLETRFIEYETEEVFMADGTFDKSADGKQKGVISLFMNKDGNPHYVYGPLSLTTYDAYEKWNDETMDKNEDKVWLKNIFWKLDEVSVVLVVRNKNWFEGALPIFENVWKTIVTERETGYEHRAPNKRNRTSTIKQQSLAIRECMIKVPDFNITEENKHVIQKSNNTENIVIDVDTSN
jgi:putative phage-type endonuclease